MNSAPNALRFLSDEARSLLSRLDRVRPFALQMPMVPAASVSPAALTAIERYLIEGRRKLRQMVLDYLRQLSERDYGVATSEKAYRRFTLLRLRFHAVLSQLDIFADVLNQRSEHDTGVWLAGLDAAAADALALPGGYYETPPVICYLDRGIGAAIRRARTRLPGGGENPVAIVRVPRERMIGGSGISSSLIHEVGHQASAILDLVNSLRPVLQGLKRMQSQWRIAWHLWDRWTSEVLADFWSVARVGIGSTLGLMGVVSLPRAFVFRLNLDAPHPVPWIRVKLSCAIGQALYPDPQWERLSALWESFYPVSDLNEEKRNLFAILMKTMPGFVTLLVHHRPKALRGRSLVEALRVKDRQPTKLRAYYLSWGGSYQLMRSVPPTFLFAVISQAKADGKITPEEESRVFDYTLRYWALKGALDTTTICAKLAQPRALAQVA
jgi:hypothetical protein